MIELSLVLFCLTVLATPLFFCPLKLLDGFLMPQMGVSAIGIAIALFVFSYVGIFPINLVAILVLLQFVYLMTSTAWSTVAHNSLRDLPLIFGSCFAFLLCTVFFIDPNARVLVSLVIWFTSMFISLYAIGQRFQFDPLFKERLAPREDMMNYKKSDIHPAFQKGFIDNRAIGTLGNTNFASGYFISTLPFLIFLCIEVNPWFCLSLIIFAASIVATGARNGALSVVAGTLFFMVAVSTEGMVFDALFYCFGNLPPLQFIVYMILAICICAQLWIWAKQQTPLKDEFGVKGQIGCPIDTMMKFIRSMSDTSSDLNTMLDVENTHQDHPISHLRFRFRYWKAAWWLIKRRWLQGYGLKSYRKEVYNAQGHLNLADPTYLGYGYQTPQPRECHNDWIENFVEGGIVWGFLFIAIVGIVLYHAFTCGGNWFLIVGVSTGVIAIMVNAFFFFPLRLGSSGVVFWTSLALLESITTPTITASFIPSHWISFMLLGALVAMIWEGAIKPNLGNWYFQRYNFSQIPFFKEKYLLKAIELCPKETIFHTHALISYLHIFPLKAKQFAECMRQHFDGMTPGWVMAYNSGTASMINKHWEEALQYFKDSLFYLPDFGTSRREYHRCYPFAPLPRRINLKKASEETIMAIAHYRSEMKVVQGTISQIQLSIANAILQEKVNKGIPIDWPYDLTNHTFLMPDQIGGREVKELGPSKLLVVE